MAKDKDLVEEFLQESIVSEHQRLLREQETARRLSESERRYTDAVDLVREFSDGINKAPDVQQAIVLFLESAMQLTAMTSGVVHLLSKKEDGRDAIAWSIVHSVSLPKGYEYPPPRLSYEDSLTRRIVDRGIPISVSDIQSDPRINQVLIDKGLRSVIGVPLKLRGEVIGVLFLNDVQTRQFPGTEQSLLSALADQVASAVGQARVQLDLERRVAELVALTNIGRMVGNLGIDKVVDLIYEQSCRIIDLSDALFSVAFYDQNEDRVDFPLAVEQDNGQIIDVVRWGEREAPYREMNEDSAVAQLQPRMRRRPPGLTEYVIDTMQPTLIVEDFPRITQMLGIQTWAALGRMERPICSWLGVPLLVGECVVGVICNWPQKLDHVLT